MDQEPDRRYEKSLIPEAQLVDSRPKRLPRFLRDIEQLGDEVGFIEAVHQTLAQDNVTVTVDGDFDRLQHHQDGVLFVGNHKNQWEFVAAMAMVHRMGRDDMLNVAKFYVQRQVHQLLGRAASRLVIPVYPRLFASDRSGPFNGQAGNRLLHRRHLLTLAESAAVNERSLRAASERLEAAGVVNIFPVGDVREALTYPWRTGVGRIIQQLPEDAKTDILIAPYNIDVLARTRLLGAVAMRGRGVFGRPQSIDAQLGPLQTVAELRDTLPDELRNDPDAITQRLRQQFVDYFESVTSS